MIGAEDAMTTYEQSEYDKILPVIHDWFKDPNIIKDGKKVAENFIYSSDNNTDWMPIESLQKWMVENIGVIGEF